MIHPPSQGEPQIGLQQNPNDSGFWRNAFLHLVAIMDWYSRKVLAWRLSNSMDAEFCVEALKEALAKHGTPEIFDSD